jgi:signal transduction histidine kinase
VSELRSATEDVVQDAMTDVLLMAQLGRDLDHVKLLAHEHVAERSPAGMADLGARITTTLADYDGAASEFRSLPLLPEEQAPWRHLEMEVAHIRLALDSVLALSRAGEHEAAGRELVVLESNFTAAAQDLRILSGLNTRNAKDAVPRVAALERSSELYLALLAGVGGAAALLAGLVVTRTLQTRERLVRLYAERLETSNKDLDAFAARVAHDLRAPLTTARLTTDSLSRGSPQGEQQKKLDALTRSFGRMEAIIQDLLALSRIVREEAATLCDPAAATEQLRDDLTSRANRSSVILTIDVQAASVHCSEGLFRQVMWNLADNAMKYRRHDVSAHVDICGRAYGRTYELTVRDNGIGISREEARLVFEPFFRAAGGSREPGTGLGLSIVKRAIESNGGRISVTSEPGSGSEFVARLPLA